MGDKDTIAALKTVESESDHRSNSAYQKYQ